MHTEIDDQCSIIKIQNLHIGELWPNIHHIIGKSLESTHPPLPNETTLLSSLK